MYSCGDADLKKDVERLTKANTGLIHALKETENSHVELQQKVRFLLPRWFFTR